MAQDEIIIFTAENCGGCKFAKNKLKHKKNIRFVDINDPEADRYIHGDEVIVPVGYKDGEFCQVTLEKGKIHLDCNGKKINLED